MEDNELYEIRTLEIEEMIEKEFPQLYLNIQPFEHLRTKVITTWGEKYPYLIFKKISDNLLLISQN